MSIGTKAAISGLPVHLGSFVNAEAQNVQMPLLSRARGGTAVADLFLRKEASLSACGTYRYRLIRHWDSSKPPMTFVMLNPSTADADLDDPTIRRCVSFAMREGFGGIVVVNLYAFRATRPSDLPKDDARTGPENERYLYDAIIEANGRPIICAWGTKGDGSLFVDWAKGHGANLMALDITKNGFPKHPLYIAGDAPLIPYPAPIPRE